MKRKLLIAIVSILILSAFIYLIEGMNWFQKSDKNPTVIKENTVLLEDSDVSIVTVGERIEHEEVYFFQWEALNEQDKKDVLNRETVFLFSIKEFQDERNKKLIQDLIIREKTVLFYGYRMNVENILAATTFDIPFYPMESSKKIYYYVYGTGYSDLHEKNIPVTIMGNFSETEMPGKIVHFLKKYYGDK